MNLLQEIFENSKSTTSSNFHRYSMDSFAEYPRIASRYFLTNPSTDFSSSYSRRSSKDIYRISSEENHKGSFQSSWIKKLPKGFFFLQTLQEFFRLFMWIPSGIPTFLPRNPKFLIGFFKQIYFFQGISPVFH